MAHLTHPGATSGKAALVVGVMVCSHWLRHRRRIVREALMARYDADTTTLGTLLDDPDVVAILDKHAPGLSTNPMIGMAKAMPASQAIGMASGMIGADKAEAIRAEVEALD